MHMHYINTRYGHFYSVTWSSMNIGCQNCLCFIDLCDFRRQGGDHKHLHYSSYTYTHTQICMYVCVCVFMNVVVCMCLCYLCDLWKFASQMFCFCFLFFQPQTARERASANLWRLTTLRLTGGHLSS